MPVWAHVVQAISAIMWLETHIDGANAIENAYGKIEYVWGGWIGILLGHIDGKIHRKFSIYSSFADNSSIIPATWTQNSAIISSESFICFVSIFTSFSVTLFSSFCYNHNFRLKYFTVFEVKGWITD